MGIFSLQRDIKDLTRVRTIMSILIEQGFAAQLAKTSLSKHMPWHHRLEFRTQETTPERARKTLEALGPTFVKLGQLLSLRPDLIPVAFCEEFKKLQDHVTPVPLSAIRTVIEQELHQPIEKIFRTFSNEPLAAASVSQVHTATLHDGTKVVVKVQRPGIAEIMAHDVDIMEYIAHHVDKHYPDIRLTQIVDEFKSYTRQELDFGFELRNLMKFKEFFAQNPDVLIPKAYDQLSTTRILVLDYIDGIHISDKAALQKHGVDQKQLARIGFESMIAQIFELGIFHADPHPGNLLAVKKTRKGKKANARQTMGRRSATHGDVLVYLDFGIVGFIDEELQIKFLDFLQALVQHDIKGVVRTIMKIGQPKSDFDQSGFEQEIGPFIRQWQDTTLRQEKLSMLLYRIITQATHYGIQIPANVILVAKAFVTIEGTGVWLDPEFNLSEASRVTLEPIIKRRYGIATMRKELGKTANEMRGIIAEVPEAAHALMDRLKEGSIQVSIDRKEFARIGMEYELSTTKHSLAYLCGAIFIGSCIIAGLTPNLEMIGIKLYLLGFTLFALMFLAYTRASVRTHKYMKELER